MKDLHGRRRIGDVSSLSDSSSQAGNVLAFVLKSLCFSESVLMEHHRLLVLALADLSDP